VAVTAPPDTEEASPPSIVTSPPDNPEPPPSNKSPPDRSPLPANDTPLRIDTDAPPTRLDPADIVTLPAAPEVLAPLATEIDPDEDDDDDPDVSMTPPEGFEVASRVESLTYECPITAAEPPMEFSCVSPVCNHTDPLSKPDPEVTTT